MFLLSTIYSITDKKCTMKIKFFNLVGFRDTGKANGALMKNQQCGRPHAYVCTKNSTYALFVSKYSSCLAAFTWKSVGNSSLMMQRKAANQQRARLIGCAQLNLANRKVHCIIQTHLCIVHTKVSFLQWHSWILLRLSKFGNGEIKMPLWSSFPAPERSSKHIYTFLCTQIP